MNGSCCDGLATGIGKGTTNQGRGRIEPVGGARPQIVDGRQWRKVGGVDPVGEIPVDPPADEPLLERRQALRPR